LVRRREVILELGGRRSAVVFLAIKGQGATPGAIEFPVNLDIGPILEAFVGPGNWPVFPKSCAAFFETLPSVFPPAVCVFRAAVSPCALAVSIIRRSHTEASLGTL
jgi:hypothetical protein